MSKTLKTLGLTIFFAVLAWMPLMAQEGGAPDTKSKLYMLSLIVAGAVEQEEEHASSAPSEARLKEVHA